MSFSSILNSSHINNYPKPPPGPAIPAAVSLGLPYFSPSFLKVVPPQWTAFPHDPFTPSPLQYDFCLHRWLKHLWLRLSMSYILLSAFSAVLGTVLPSPYPQSSRLLPWLPRHSSGCPTSPDAFLSFCSLILWSANKPPSSVLRSHFTLHSTLPWETVFVQLPFPPVPGCLADVYLQLSSFFWLPDAYI